MMKMAMIRMTMIKMAIMKMTMMIDEDGQVPEDHHDKNQFVWWHWFG